MTGRRGVYLFIKDMTVEISTTFIHSTYRSLLVLEVSHSVHTHATEPVAGGDWCGKLGRSYWSRVLRRAVKAVVLSLW